MPRAPNRFAALFVVAFAFISPATTALPLLDGCKSKDWLTCRHSLIASIFNASSLPSRVAPDYIVQMPEYAMHGELTFQLRSMPLTRPQVFQALAME